MRSCWSGYATSTDEQARRDVAAIETLPSAPGTLIELVEALDCDDGSAHSVGVVIERDPAAAAKVMHLVNSFPHSILEGGVVELGTGGPPWPARRN